MKKHMELGNITIEEAEEDLRHLYDPTSLCYNDNYYAKSLRDKYGMNLIKLGKVVKELELKEEADLNNELYRRGELR